MKEHYHLKSGQIGNMKDAMDMQRRLDEAGFNFYVVLHPPEFDESLEEEIS